LDRLSFSLDAATPELFNEIRRGADFYTILQNIRTLNAMKKQLHRDDKPILSIMYCAMKSNIQELPKLVLLADQLNMIHGIALINIVEYDQAEGECLTRYPELAERYLNEANILATKLAIPLDMPGTFDVCLQPLRLSFWERAYRNYREFRRSFDRMTLLKIKLSRTFERVKHIIIPHSSALKNSESGLSATTFQSSKMIRVKDCRDPWDFMFINIHGDVRVCCVSHRIMGNVHDDDVMRIWNNKLYKEFRERILTSDPPEECHTCPMRGWHTIPAS
jgi:radical SAM protein with 4Fe4S-binding SPASM domain